MKRSGKVAVGGICGALSLLCMLLTAFPYGTYALPALAGVVLLPLCLEAGEKWGLTAYVAVAALSLLVAPSMEAKVLFVGFFGYYPVVKSLLERLPWRWLSWALKLALFNVAMVAAYCLMLYAFHLEADTFELFGVNLPLVFLAVGNAVFVVFDMALCGVIDRYWRDWHPRFCRMFK